MLIKKEVTIRLYTVGNLGSKKKKNQVICIFPLIKCNNYYYYTLLPKMFFKIELSLETISRQQNLCCKTRFTCWSDDSRRRRPAGAARQGWPRGGNKRHYVAAVRETAEAGRIGSRGEANRQSHRIQSVNTSPTRMSPTIVGPRELKLTGDISPALLLWVVGGDRHQSARELNYSTRE